MYFDLTGKKIAVLCLIPVIALASIVLYVSLQAPPQQTDTLSPKFEVVYPYSNLVVSGEIQVTAKVIDRGPEGLAVVGVDAVYWCFDGGKWHEMIYYQGNVWFGIFDTTAQEDGLHSITYKAIDNSGNVETKTVNFEIRN